MSSVRAALIRTAFWLSVLIAPTRAALAAEVETSITTDSVSVGQTFRVQLALPVSDGDPEPSAPKLPVRGPAEVRGPSIGTSRSISMNNFSFSSQTQVTASYSVTATGPGKIVIGPGSFQVGSKRVNGDVFEVEVHDGPPRGRGRSFGRDPFDDFFRGNPFDLLRDRGARLELPPAPERLALDNAPDQIGFLVARVSKESVVVGETVNLTIYAYGSRGAFQEANPVEPSLGDFLSFREVQSSFEEQRYQTAIGGRPYQIAKLRQIVLVPLRAGTLEIGPMHAILAGRGYPPKNNALGYPVESAPLRLEVLEAPKRGQPPGFFPGDVGQFQMDLELSPTKLSEGEYALLSVRLKGKGNLPTRVQLPEGAGWEWQKPITRGEPAVENGELNGSRTIEVGLRVTQAGALELGDIILPYFDPRRGEYEVLRKRLPTLQVEARPAEAAPPLSGSDPKTPPGQKEPAPRDWSLAPRIIPASSLDRVPIPALTWPIILGIPPLLAFVTGLGLALRRARGRLSTERIQPERPRKQALSSLKLLRAAMDQSLSSEIPIALRRGVEAVLLARFNTSGRGLTQGELNKELTERGCPEDDIRWILETLARIEESAFGGEPLSVTEAKSAAQRLKSILDAKGTR